MDDTFWRVLLLGLAIAVAVQSFAIVGLMRETGELLIRGGNPPDADQEQGPPPMSRVSIPGVVGGKPLLALFMTPGCPFCEDLVPTLAPLRAEYGDQVELMPILMGGEERELTKYAATLPVPSRTDIPKLAEEWDVPGAPFAVAIDAAGAVRAAYVPQDADALDQMVQRLIETGSEADDQSNVVAASS